MVANEVLYRPDLSWKAKGLYAYLFSKPDGWDFSGDRIVKEGSDGRKVIFASLKELEKIGLLDRKRQKDGRMDYLLKYSERQKDAENPTEPFALFGQLPKRSMTKTGSVSNKDEESNKDKDIAAVAAKEWILEEKLKEMESQENTYLDIIATFIREKPVKIENSKQLSAVISRYCRVGKALSGAYTNRQIFDAAEKIRKENKKRPGNEVDWTLETIYKTLTK